MEGIRLADQILRITGHPDDLQRRLLENAPDALRSSG
jgi:hypothetical protein